MTLPDNLRFLYGAEELPERQNSGVSILRVDSEAFAVNDPEELEITIIGRLDMSGMNTVWFQSE